MGLFSDCKQMVKFSGTSVEIGTIKGPVQIPVEIGGVKIKPQLLQAAGSILQILDWLQFTGCQRIHELKKLKDIPGKTVADLILRQDEDARMISYVAIISITVCSSPDKFEKVLADWIASALPRARPSAKSAPTFIGETLKKEFEDQLSETVSAFPYLSQAISRKEPFNIRKSLRSLTQNQ